MDDLPSFTIGRRHAPAYADSGWVGFSFVAAGGRTAPWVLKTIVTLGALNLIVFLVEAVRIGGIALRGGFIGGRYYVAMFGQMTEVSRDVFLYSLMHSLVTLFGALAALGSAMILRAMERR
ncbi:MAG TPA: hypothetical protein VLV55_14070 [Rhizomicrobium sp.]|nr:hypothetical protein [Rhizomicrobium sp.]